MFAASTQFRENLLAIYLSKAGRKVHSQFPYEAIVTIVTCKSFYFSILHGLCCTDV